MSTWDYTSSTDTSDEIPEEWIWERLRFRRDKLLAISDFRMVSDAPWNREDWAVYRQTLRDLPSATTDPRQAIWPQQPKA